MRHLLALVLLCSVILGCRSRGEDENLSYNFYKNDISQSQLLQDEAEIRRTAGVVRVIARQKQDGSGSIEVEVVDKHHILVQQKLSDMGYSKGLH
jgi:hypothetical protein